MRTHPLRVAGDVLLIVLGVGVLAASALTLRTGHSTTVASAAADVTAPLPAVHPSATALPRALSVVAVGPDMPELQPAFASAARADVASVSSAADLATVTATPDVVVVEILAGTKTTLRAKAALDAVTSKWPDATVFVVGPFSANDRKSAEAVRKAAQGRATFLDPVELHWRTSDATATLTGADIKAVATALAAAIV